jgi:signal transduction histidine kinase
MEDSSIEKIRERIARIREKTADASGRIKQKPPAASAPAETVETDMKRHETAIRDQNTEYLETKKKNLEQDNEDLRSKLSELGTGAGRLKEKVSALEKEKKELAAEREILVEKIEKQEKETWIRFSLGIMQEYLSELFRYFRHTSSMAREAIDICLANKELDEFIKKNIKMVDDMYKKTLHIMEQSKIKFTFPELRKSQVIINEIINNVVSRFSSNATSKIVFSTKFSGPDLKIKADPAFIEEMATNVIQNSVEAIDRAGCVEIVVQQEQAGITIEISDTGCGIPPHLISKVFRPFFSTKNDGEAIKHPGLGLTRAYWICQLHGGEIVVESQMNKGTKVIMTVPGCDEDAAS